MVCMKGEKMNVAELLSTLKEIEDFRDACVKEKTFTTEEYDTLINLLDEYHDILLSRNVNI